MVEWVRGNLVDLWNLKERALDEIISVTIGYPDKRTAKAGADALGSEALVFRMAGAWSAAAVCRARASVDRFEAACGPMHEAIRRGILRRPEPGEIPVVVYSKLDVTTHTIG